MTTVKKELGDFAAHAASAFIILLVATWLGVYLTPAGAVFLAWTCGLIREITEWHDGGRHPFTWRGWLDQSGWVAGGVAFIGALAAGLHA